MRSEICTNHAQRKKLALSSWGALVTAGLVASTTPAAAQMGTTGNTNTQPTTGIAKAIEWDLPANVDLQPGAMVVDIAGGGTRIWFVTKVGAPAANLYRIDLDAGKKVKDAQVFSWQLDPSGPTSGLRRIKPSKDKQQRFVFVRNPFTLQRIDNGSCTTAVTTSTVSCDRTTWDSQFAVPLDEAAANPPLNDQGGSDIAIDDMSNVYAAVAVLGADPSDPSSLIPDPASSYIQRLETNKPGLDGSSNRATRWPVGGSAGFCPEALGNPSGATSPCLSGITVDPRNRYLVYYSEPTGGTGTGAIGELDTSTTPAKVRRWFLSEFGVDGNGMQAREPRQLLFDNDGTIWAVTGSGHLVRLDPRKSQASIHAIPGGTTNNPYGVAPDGGVIGYTGTDLNKVAMLLPVRRTKNVPVHPSIVYPVIVSIPFTTVKVERVPSQAHPTQKTLAVTRTPQADGTFVEANTLTPPNDSMFPLGITPDLSAGVGTFFYAVGQTSGDFVLNRFGRVRLPRNRVPARVERDDDDNDDDGKRADADEDVDDDGVPNSSDADNDDDGDPDIADDDDDNDGIEDGFDTKDQKESKQTSDQDVAPGQYAQDTFAVSPDTLLVVASAVSSDLLAPVAVEIVNEAGQLVASSVAAAGTSAVTFVPPAAGGNYTLRVKNQGSATGAISTKILTRELWPIAVVGGL